MAHLTTRSILLRKPQYPDYLVEETSSRPSSRELNAGVRIGGHSECIWSLACVGT
ncbi:hypothetical protein M405DRAFT_821307, partial [Rhizopogon salebrosus TDB-379]